MAVFSTYILATGSRNVQRVTLRRRLALSVTVWMERRALRGLDAGRLADLGLTQAQAEAEAGRPLWDLPSDRVFSHRS
ncbi:DUF1127 domain-containing protein [Pseudooctadecabacter sp.]|uniref:DUF1127 domain-containing protein n=1 Tax=Pseudooctadecabacter sp. TaxID=1966338 RepID=UPI0035C85490